MSKKLVITQKRSTIGCTDSQIATVKALGLKRINHQVVLQDTPATRGQVLKIQHLLDVSVQK